MMESMKRSRGRVAVCIMKDVCFWNHKKIQESEEKEIAKKKKRQKEKPKKKKKIRRN